MTEVLELISDKPLEFETDDLEAKEKRNAWVRIHKTFKADKKFAGKVMKSEKRKEVSWKEYRKLKRRGITTMCERRCYDPQDEMYGELVKEKVNWRIKIYTLKDEDEMGEIVLSGPENRKPRVMELGRALFELSKRGIYVREFHETTGKAFVGEPCTLDGDRVETYEESVAHFHKSYARAVSTMSKWILEQCIMKFGAKSGPRIAEQRLKKWSKKPRYNVENMFGYARKSKITGKYQLTHSHKYPVCKKKSSGKRSKGGGGGAYRVGTPSAVNRAVEGKKHVVEGRRQMVEAVVRQSMSDTKIKPIGRLGMIKEIAEKLDKALGGMG